MRRLLVACLVALLAFTALPAALYAGFGDDGRPPLIVVRFSQPNVAFEQSLINAVKKAVEAKPDVIFDVSARPGIGSVTAQESLTRVTDAIQRAGIPVVRIYTMVGPSGGNRFDEVLVYVR